VPSRSWYSSTWENHQFSQCRKRSVTVKQVPHVSLGVYLSRFECRIENGTCGSNDCCFKVPYEAPGVLGCLSVCSFKAPIEAPCRPWVSICLLLQSADRGPMSSIHPSLHPLPPSPPTVYPCLCVRSASQSSAYPHACPTACL
jgi:hypothetical protein